jgi:hypothetical protein
VAPKWFRYWFATFTVASLWFHSWTLPVSDNLSMYIHTYRYTYIHARQTGFHPKFILIVLVLMYFVR